MRLYSWNVNGIRAAMKKDFLSSFETMAPDLLCVQETKAQDGQVLAAVADIEHYHVYCNSAERKGYSGTAVFSRHEPLDVQCDMGIPEHDQEGRVIALEFAEHFLVTVYVPNSGSELQRLDYRQRWDRDFLHYLRNLEASKPVIVCGDFNVAHRDIDIARPKPNYNKSAGYMQAEIDGMDRLREAGFTDSFRYLHPDTVKYSWWSFRAGARQRNVGWRIDYLLISQSLRDKVKRAEILDDVMGSDHCPVMLELQCDTL